MLIANATGAQVAKATAAMAAPWSRRGTQAQARDELARCRAEAKDAERCERLDYEFRQRFNVAP